MSRRPESRQGSVMELVHELQAIESELGLPQTPVEIAVDEWASSSVGDLEDRTVIKGGAVPRGTVSQRRRRRRGMDQGYSSIGTIVKEDPVGSKSTGTAGRRSGLGIQALAWAVVAAAVLVIALGTLAALVLIRSSGTTIPSVGDVQARVVDDTVEFTWADPGLAVGDAYRITPDGAAPVLQRTTSFVVDAEPGQRVCVTVEVTRDAREVGPAVQKCADIPE
jgi:hypothetical protein